MNCVARTGGLEHNVHMQQEVPNAASPTPLCVCVLTTGPERLSGVSLAYTALSDQLPPEDLEQDMLRSALEQSAASPAQAFPWRSPQGCVIGMQKASPPMPGGGAACSVICLQLANNTKVFHITFHTGTPNMKRP